MEKIPDEYILRLENLNKMKAQQSHYLWICLDFKIVVTKMTLHAKLVYWSAVVVPNFRFLCIVSDAHAYVNSTTATPYIVWQLKTAKVVLRNHYQILFTLKKFC